MIMQGVGCMAGLHHRGSHPRRAKRVRDAAYADPLTRCWRCGLTLVEEQARHLGRVTWQAGHLRDGDPFAPLAAEHSTCNQAAGARVANEKKRVTRLNTSRRWY